MQQQIVRYCIHTIVDGGDWGHATGVSHRLETYSIIGDC